MRYVVAYDIVEDRARVRIAGILERFGVRVQKSVFECRLEARDLERLLRRLERELTAVGGAGNVRVYRLCSDCYGASAGGGFGGRGGGGWRAVDRGVGWAGIEQQRRRRSSRRGRLKTRVPKPEGLPQVLGTQRLAAESAPRRPEIVPRSLTID